MRDLSCNIRCGGGRDGFDHLSQLAQERRARRADLALPDPAPESG